MPKHTVINLNKELPGTGNPHHGMAQFARGRGLLAATQ